MTEREVFFEQKLAEIALRLANAEKMAEQAKANGSLLEARKYLQWADKLKKDREELLVKINEAFPVKGRHGGTF